MNKILMVEGLNKIKTGIYEVSSDYPSSIEIEGKVVLYSYKSINNDLKIKCLDNSELRIEDVRYIVKDTVLDIDIDNNNLSDIRLLIINKGVNKVIINIVIHGLNNEVLLNIRGINEDDDSSLEIICNGEVAFKTENNIFNENIKGLITGMDKIIIKPNIDVYTKEVIANHATTIGSYNLEELFYLTSHGINIETAKKIIRDGFLNSIFSEEIRNKLKMEVR